MVVEPLSVRASTLLNTNISATSRPVAIKFYQKHHWGGGKVASGFGSGWIRTLVSMATAPIDLQWKNYKKSPKPQGPELSYFVCSNVVLFINPANYAPGVHTGPPYEIFLVRLVCHINVAYKFQTC